MEFFVSLVQNLACGVVAQAGGSLACWVVQYFKTKAQEMKSAEVLNLLAQVGATSPADIKQLVEKTFGKDHDLSDAQRQELTGLLIRLTHGAKTLTSQGTPRSSYLRCEKLIDQLLRGMQTKRAVGQSIGKGHNWVLERFLGMGTFGEVWLARNNKAPKLPPRAYKFFTHEGASIWLQQEADNLSSLMQKLGDQPGIVQLLDVGVADQEYPFLGFEYVGGGSLEDWILEDADVRVPLRVNDLVSGIVRAMAAAHRQGVYHRDLKPANILLTTSPNVYPRITDFGLALTDGSAGASVADGSLGLAQVGTPMYWPPEAQRLDLLRKPAQDDVFALGVIWHQLLVSKLERPPYDFEAELRASGLDSHTIRLVSRCLAHPDRRFASAVELAASLDDAGLPVWNPVPEGLYDVQYLMREYLSTGRA